MKVKGLVAQSYPTLCNPMDYIPPDSSAHGLLQARILEWVAFPVSNPGLLHCKQILYHVSQHKNKLKWIQDLNIRLDIIKLFEENIGRTLFDINCSNIFF